MPAAARTPRLTWPSVSLVVGTFARMSLPLSADSGYDTALDELAHVQREQSRVFARQVGCWPPWRPGPTGTAGRAPVPGQSLLLDVAGTCLLGQGSAGARLVEAERLATHLPTVLSMPAAGFRRAAADGPVRAAAATWSPPASPPRPSAPDRSRPTPTGS